MGLDMYLSKTKGKWTQAELSKLLTLRFQAYSKSQEMGEAFDAKNPLEVKTLASWHKHRELHEYFQQLYVQTTPIEYQQTPFCWTLLVIEREVIYDLLTQANQRVEQLIASETLHGSLFAPSTSEDWKDTIEVFERVLNEVDFENETLCYGAH